MGILWIRNSGINALWLDILPSTQHGTEWEQNSQTYMIQYVPIKAHSRFVIWNLQHIYIYSRFCRNRTCSSGNIKHTRKNLRISRISCCVHRHMFSYKFTLLKSQTLSIKFWLTLLQLSVDWKLPNWKWTWSISSVLAILLVKLKLFHPFWFFFIYFIMTGKAILSYINATPGKISINVTFHLLAHDCHMPDPSNSLCTIVYCISTGRDKVLLS